VPSEIEKSNLENLLKTTKAFNNTSYKSKNTLP